MVALEVLHLYPIMYLNVAAALANVDPSLEDAARNMGDSGFRLFRKVTFPLMLPGYFAGAVLVFIWAFTDLGTPLIFGYSRVVAVQIFDKISDIHTNPMAYALVVVVILFTAASEPFFKRILAGLLALTKVTNVFGDALSYLRLFALGLASSSLAVAFNDLADQVRSVLPGFGVLFGLLVFLVGHSLNLLLAIVSGFIHGLRLNFIEFFNWSIPHEGRPFRAFARKEAEAWNR